MKPNKLVLTSLPHKRRNNKATEATRVRDRMGLMKSIKKNKVIIMEAILFQ